MNIKGEKLRALLSRDMAKKRQMVSQSLKLNVAAQVATKVIHWSWRSLICLVGIFGGMFLVFFKFALMIRFILKVYLKRSLSFVLS